LCWDTQIAGHHQRLPKSFSRTLHQPDRQNKTCLEQETITKTDRNEKNIAFTENVTANNVHLTVHEVRKQSSILLEMEKANQIKIVGGLYNVETGQVVFLRIAFTPNFFWNLCQIIVNLSG